MLEALTDMTYEQMTAAFEWTVPTPFNIGTMCADRHPADDLALIAVDPDSESREYTFGELTELSDRFANALVGLGVEPGDRVGVVLPQRVEAGVAHLATYKLGAVAVPLSPLFGPEALKYRLGDSGAKVVVADGRAVGAAAEAVGSLPGLTVVLADPAASLPDARDLESRDFWQLVENASAEFTPAETGPEDPALLIYTSGTTGPPKGALHGHRVLLGHLPGFELMFDRFPQPNDRAWTPADWAWAGGLLDLLLPSWYHGRPVVGTNRAGSFDPQWAADVIRTHDVTTAFLPPSALRMLRAGAVDLRESALRTVMSGGESLGHELSS